MNVYPILWTYQPRRDGTCNIKIYEYSDSGKAYHRTQYFVAPSDWDDNKRRVRKSHPLAGAINQRLKGRVREIELEVISGERSSNNSLLDLVATHIDEIDRGLVQVKANTVKAYRGHLNRLQDYAQVRKLKDIRFDDVDQAFYQDFSDYLQATGCRLPGIGKHIKHIKKFMNLGLDRQLHSNRAHQSRAFKVHRGKLGKSIYLNEQEIEAIQELDLEDQPHLQREQERFLVAYYLILRYSDSVRIRPDQFFEQKGRRFYRNEAKKTDQGNYVPVKPIVWQILEGRNFDLSEDTNQEANRKLKSIAAMAGLDQKVPSADGEEVPKWSLVTTHTARRSAATNLYLSGMELKIISQLGGWKSEQALRSYLLASGLDVAKLALDNPFFN